MTYINQGNPEQARLLAEGSPTQWMAMAEAISFVAATLGESFTTAQGNAVYWTCFAKRRDDGVWPYPVGVERISDTQVRMIAEHEDIVDDPTAAMKLYALIGWAVLHGHLIQPERLS